MLHVRVVESMQPFYLRTDPPVGVRTLTRSSPRPAAPPVTAAGVWRSHLAGSRPRLHLHGAGLLLRLVGARGLPRMEPCEERHGICSREAQATCRSFLTEHTRGSRAATHTNWGDAAQGAPWSWRMSAFYLENLCSPEQLWLMHPYVTGLKYTHVGIHVCACVCARIYGCARMYVCTCIHVYV